MLISSTMALLMVQARVPDLSRTVPERFSNGSRTIPVEAFKVRLTD